MILIVPFILTLVLATYPLILLPERWVLYMSATSVALWGLGGLSRRFPFFVASGIIVAGEYMGSLVAGNHRLDLWAAITFGLGLYLVLELGYDLTILFRRPPPKSVWLRRGGYFLIVSLLALTVSMAVVLMAAEALKVIPVNLVPWLNLVGIGIVVGCTSFVVGLWLKERGGKR